MAEDQRPPKKVVKRIVRKPVDQKPTPAETTVRFGRPASPAPTARPTKSRETNAKPAKTRTAKTRTAKTRTAKTRKSITFARPRTNVTKKAAVGIASLGSRVRSTVGDTTFSIRDKGLDAYDAVRDIRAPRFSQPIASAVTGVLVGFLAIGLNSAFSALFTAVRGTSTGGGRWGTLTVVVIAFIVFAAGEFLLSILHVRQPRLTSVLGLILALIGILLFLLGVLESAWALLFIPLLGAGTYTLSHQLIRAADADTTKPDHDTDTRQ